MLIRSYHRGFTLVELLVVIGVLAVLAAILFPMFARPRHSNSSHCLNYQKQLATATQTYLQDHRELFFTLPSSRPWSQALAGYINTDSFDCETLRGKGTITRPEFGFNAVLAGMRLGDIAQQASTPLTADLRLAGHAPDYAIHDWNRHPAPRHSSGVIMSFVDGHVQMVNFSGVEHRILFTLYSWGFDPYDGVGAVVYDNPREVKISLQSGKAAVGFMPVLTPGRMRNYHASGEFMLDVPAKLELHIGNTTSNMAALLYAPDTHAPPSELFTLTKDWYRWEILAVDGQSYHRIMRGNWSFTARQFPAPPLGKISLHAQTATKKGSTLTSRNVTVRAW